MHIQRHTHKSTHVQSAHKRKEATRHRSLVERGGRKALLETLYTQKKNVRKKPIFTNLEEKFGHTELPTKLLDCFLRNNKSLSNINQSRKTCKKSQKKRQATVHKREAIRYHKSFYKTTSGDFSILLAL